MRGAALMPLHKILKEQTPVIHSEFPFNMFHQIRENQRMAIRPHWQEIDEIIFCRRGKCTIQIGSTLYPADPGDLFFINRGQFHSGTTHDMYVEFIAIVFNKSLIASKSPHPIHMKHITPYLSGESVFRNKISQLDKGYPEILDYLQRLFEEAENRYSGYELIVIAYLQIIVTLMSRNGLLIKNEQYGALLRERSLGNFANLFEYISRHISEKITIADAVQIVNMSPYHFCKTFKKLTGKTFIQFLNEFRIDEAEELLKSSNLAITSISEKVGFCNINYFDQIFKKYKGMTPSSYRKTLY
jgi:AraC-like DNA-binding protein